SHYRRPHGEEFTSTAMPSVEDIVDTALTNQLGYRFPWANVSVNIPDPNSFQVCINGVALSGPISDGGIVLEVGPAVAVTGVTIAQPDNAVCTGMVVVKNYLTPSLRPR